MRLGRLFAAGVMAALMAAGTLVFNPAVLRAQNDSGGLGAGGEGMGMSPPMPGSDASATANDPSMPPPLAKMHISQQIAGSMLAAPPYGIAPMKVGFFVLADDPEGLGFLTYSWNFGDGTVSSLPPELYIFHTYQNPGSYLCSLVVKTVDGREHTFMQGVVVKAPGG